MYNCKNASKNMSAYIDNLLSQSEKTAFEQHIKNCESCKKELAELQSVLALTSTFNAEVPDTFTANVMEKVQKEAVHKNKFSVYAIPKYATVFAAVFLFAVVLKTPVMEYFEKSYIENEPAPKQSMADSAKINETENIEYTDKFAFDTNNQADVNSSKPEQKPNNEANSKNLQNNQKQQSSQALNDKQIEDNQTEDNQTEDNQNNGFFTREQLGLEENQSTPQSESTADVPMIARVTSYNVDEQPENKASSGGSSLQNSALVSDVTLIIHTSIPLNDAKEIIENAVGCDVLVENNEISINLSNREYKKLFNALGENTAFDGFDNEIAQETVNVIFVAE